MTTQTTTLNSTNDYDKVGNKDFVLSPHSFPEDLRDSSADPYLFVVGDVMGRFDLLDRAIRKIETPKLIGYEFGSADKVVFLGNYIGQKGNTCETMCRLRMYKQKRPNNVHLLRGRYDQVFLRFDDRFAQAVVGRETINSYRKRNVSIYTTDKCGIVDGYDLIADRKFVAEQTQLFFETKDLFIASGGLRPDKPIVGQHPLDFVFAQMPEEDDTNYGKRLIHGCSKVKRNKAMCKTNRICLDTGASICAHGILTIGVFHLKTGKLEDILTVT